MNYLTTNQITAIHIFLKGFFLQTTIIRGGEWVTKCKYACVTSNLHVCYISHERKRGIQNLKNCPINQLWGWAIGIRFPTYFSWEECLFTTTCAISAYHHYSCEFEPCSWRGVLDTTLCDKVCQWLASGQWFSPDTLVASANKTACLPYL
jgi:hypothetical protein